MSLLMKALANAEKEKSDQAQPEKIQKITLDEAPATIGNVAPFPSLNPLKTLPTQQEAAANVFSAARLPASYFTQVLWGLGFATIALIIWLGSQFSPASSDTVPVLTTASHSKPPAQIAQVEKTLPPLPVTSAAADNIAPLAQPNPSTTNLFAATPPQKNQVANAARVETPPLRNTETLEADKQSAASLQNSDLQLTLKKTGPAVEPALLSAYQAFQQDDFNGAQQLYRQVLKNDVRNIDALLGMAAIAQKQGRNLDALGWYQKILALEPTHAMALAATVELQPTTDKNSQLSYLKNQIAQQPENPHLYAALGNLYAEQNQWQEAQAAYFEAVRFSPQSAEFVFNLAVSLEHLRQPQLALMQYQRVLQLIERTGASSPDAQSVKNRIAALQPTP